MRKSTKIYELMSKYVIVGDKNHTFSEVCQLFLEKKLHHLPIVDENDKDKIYIADGKCLKTGWIFWECYDFKAIVDFTGFAPKFTVERSFKNQPDGKTIIDLSTSSIINTPYPENQNYPGMNCHAGDSWCFISAPGDDWFFIRIRPV